MGIRKDISVWMWNGYQVSDISLIWIFDLSFGINVWCQIQVFWTSFAQWDTFQKEMWQINAVRDPSSEKIKIKILFKLDQADRELIFWDVTLQFRTCSSVHINSLCEQEFISPFLFCGILCFGLIGKSGVQVPNRLAWRRCKKKWF